MRKVLIPVIDAGDPKASPSEARLWEVYCGAPDAAEQAATDKQIGKDRIPTVAALGSVNRYPSGRRAYLAVKRLLAPDLADPEGDHPPDKPTKQMCRDIEFALDHRRLRSGDGGDWVANIKDSSSDLGIALCLLMDVTQSKTPIVAATGELGDTQDSKDLRDLVVKPVAGVAEKLRLLADLKRNDKLPEAVTQILTPEQYVHWLYQTGTPELGLVALLPEVEVLKTLGIKVCPVGTLAEAANALDIDISAQRQRLLRRQRLKRLGKRLLAGLVGIALVVLGIIGYAMSRPLPMHWEAPQQGQMAGPYLVCQRPTGTATQRVPIERGKLQMPTVPADAELGWWVRLGTAEEAQAWPYRIARDWFGYRGANLAMVLVGQTTGIAADGSSVQQPLEANRRIPLGKSWRYVWQLDGNAERTLLVLLAKRWGEFDLKGLNETLRRQFANPPGSINFSALEQFLARQADGSIHFIFDAQRGGAGCADTIDHH